MHNYFSFRSIAETENIQHQHSREIEYYVPTDFEENRPIQDVEKRTESLMETQDSIANKSSGDFGDFILKFVLLLILVFIVLCLLTIIYFGIDAKVQISSRLPPSSTSSYHSRRGPSLPSLHQPEQRASDQSAFPDKSGMRIPALQVTIANDFR